ncbi:hypothetical protein [Streptomyces avermitilis]|uniref:hypothetical protein n=1 Tax=Streptomyces avermitilis TaxID=33903 RepID=UPI0036B697CF
MSGGVRSGRRRTPVRAGRGMSREPDFFEDLRRVGALKKGLLGGRPADHPLSKIPEAQVSRDTIGAWLRGERFPQRLEPLLSVLGKIRVEAASQNLLNNPADGVSGESIAELLAEDRWREKWTVEQRRRTQSNQKDAEREQARRVLADEERWVRRAALADRPRPVRSWTPKRLGVHPAIPGHPAGPDGAGFVLPAYVSRPHDDRLHTRLAAAVTDSTSLLVVVRGESCTGKTRTAFQALTAVPDDFHLLFPADADSLLAMLAADALGPRTVLWLNEAQHYLDGPAGEAAAAALLRRLDTDGPFIALATLWPDRDKALTTTPTAGKDDAHRQARALLAQADYIHLPPSFAAHLDTVRHMALRDASLAAALETGGTDVTQVLAAGPDLVAHYEHTDGPHGVYGKALISVAMDAYRLGITGPLLLAFLHDAAPGYVTDSERAAADPDTWFSDALTHARTLIKQIIRPLQDVPNPPGWEHFPTWSALPTISNCMAAELASTSAHPPPSGTPPPTGSPIRTTSSTSPTPLAAGTGSATPHTSTVPPSTPEAPPPRDGWRRCGRRPETSAEPNACIAPPPRPETPLR